MNYFLSIIIIGFLLISCESKKEKSLGSKASEDTSAVETTVNKEPCVGGIYVKHAHAYNNFIIENQGYILEENIRFIKTVKESDSKENVAEAYKSLETQTKRSLDSLEKLCSFNGNVEFKNASIELFKFYKTAWSDYKELVKNETKAKRIKAFDKIKIRFNDIHSIQEKKLEENFSEAHTNFVNEYRLHVRSTPLHEELDSIMYLK